MVKVVEMTDKELKRLEDVVIEQFVEVRKIQRRLARKGLFVHEHMILDRLDETWRMVMYKMLKRKRRLDD